MLAPVTYSYTVTISPLMFHFAGLISFPERYALGSPEKPYIPFLQLL